MSNTTNQLNYAIRLRPAVEGDPSQGPYPATVDEVADEVIGWLREMDQAAARGLAYAVLVKLGAAFEPEPGDPVEADALRHSYHG